MSSDIPETKEVTSTYYDGAHHEAPGVGVDEVAEAGKKYCAIRGIHDTYSVGMEAISFIALEAPSVLPYMASSVEGRNKMRTAIGSLTDEQWQAAYDSGYTDGTTVGAKSVQITTNWEAAYATATEDATNHYRDAKALREEVASLQAKMSAMERAAMQKIADRLHESTNTTADPPQQPASLALVERVFREEAKRAGATLTYVSVRDPYVGETELACVAVVDYTTDECGKLRVAVSRLSLSGVTESSAATFSSESVDEFRLPPPPPDNAFPLLGAPA